MENKDTTTPNEPTYFESVSGTEELPTDVPDQTNTEELITEEPNPTDAAELITEEPDPIDAAELITEEPDPTDAAELITEALAQPDAAELTTKASTQPKKRHRCLIATVTSILVLIISLITVGAVFQDQGLIANDVTIGGQDVSGCTQEEASKIISETITQILNNTVQLSLDTQTLAIPWRDLGLNITADQALEQAYQIGREKDLWQRFLSKLDRQPTNIDLTFTWEEQTMLRTLEPLTEFNLPAIDATYVITEQNTMEVVPEQTGRMLDLPALATLIQSLDPTQESILKVPWQAIAPQSSANDLEKHLITGLLATYTTKFDPNLINRTENIRLAAQSLDQTLLEPGQSFSFNQTVGARSYESGYQEAMIIVNGKFVPGLGGGVCQVSSTLYNVLLLADLPVTERHNHALAVSYVPLGQDATVAYPSLDLKFENTQGYLLIKTRLDKDTLTISLYGQPDPERKVNVTNEIESVVPFKTLYQINSALAPGESKVTQAGQPGYVVETWLTVKYKDETIKRESLGHSRYQSLPRIIQEAPLPEAPSPEESDST